jgi:hypothetical protein
VLRAIRLTPPEQPIDIILHTPGGLVLAAEQIAKALVERKGKVTVFVPHYAMSGGTLIALAADEIVMDANAVLGPVDPQLGDMPAASIIKVVEAKGPKNVGDEFLMLADMAQKARNQVAELRRPGADEAPARETVAAGRDGPHRRPLDPRLSDHGAGRAPARPQGLDRNAAHDLRAHGPLSAGRRHPALGLVRARCAARRRLRRAAAGTGAAGQGPEERVRPSMKHCRIADALLRALARAALHQPAAMSMRTCARHRKTVVWGYLPAGRAPVLTVRSGQTVRIDTVSHQGLINGTDP